MGEHIDKSKGKIKQAVGHVTGSEKLEREGVRDENKGRTEGAINDAKDRAKKTEKSIKSIAKPRT
jgi:uncharacterized protein YjbJ (UPF0337 family)